MPEDQSSIPAPKIAVQESGFLAPSYLRLLGTFVDDKEQGSTASIENILTHKTYDVKVRVHDLL